MMMLKPYLVYFWCISALTGTSVVLKKGLGLLEVEAQVLKGARTGSWGALEWGRGRGREGIGDSGLSLPLRQLANKFRPRAESSCLGHQWVRAGLSGQRESWQCSHSGELPCCLSGDTLDL